MKVTLVQADLAWENKQANLSHLGELIDDAAPDTDLIVLPEMFSTGFTMATALAEPTQGRTTDWMAELSARYDAAVTGSFVAGENGRFFNRLHWVEPDGSVAIYDKRHRFSFAGEHEHLSAGDERLVVGFRGWRVCPLVCYDLRFPVWSRNAALDGTTVDSAFDLSIYVANWPKARRRPWNTLLEARAHENQVYVVGVNRVGEDGNGVVYCGDSAVYSPKGERLIGPRVDEEVVETVALDLASLHAFRAKFPAWRDKDAFRLDQGARPAE